MPASHISTTLWTLGLPRIAKENAHFDGFRRYCCGLPLSVVISSWLLRHHSRRVLVSWIIALSFCVTITALSKTYLYACPIGSDLVSPSGHTSLSTLTYGAIALVIAAEGSRILQTSVLGAGIGFICAIAGSRVVLNAHSGLEVGIGILIGIAALALFTRYYLRWRNEGAPLLTLVLPAILVIAVFHGQELGVESVLHAISHHLRLASFACIR